MAKRKRRRRKAAAKPAKACAAPVKEVSVHCGPRCWGFKKVLLGALVLLNVSYAWLDWASFIGWLLVVCGILRMLFPVCCCQKA